MAKKNIILTIILSAVISFTAQSQSEDCVIQLLEAERLYSLGQKYH